MVCKNSSFAGSKPNLVGVLKTQYCKVYRKLSQPIEFNLQKLYFLKNRKNTPKSNIKSNEVMAIAYENILCLILLVDSPLFLTLYVSFFYLAFK